MIDNLRRTLDKVIDTNHLTDTEVLKIYVEESKKRSSIFTYIEGSCTK